MPYVLLLMSSAALHMALIPPFFLDSVVAIGVDSPDERRAWVGTGFLYGRLLSAEGATRKHNVFLVTNKHVLDGKQVVWIRFNPDDESSPIDYPVHLFDSEGNQRWTGHPDPTIDVACFHINAGILNAEGRRYDYFQSDVHVRRRQQLKEGGASEGDPVFVLGFPMGIAAPDRHYVICRNGCLARIRDMLDGRSNDFLIDSLVFPGNSGGPVISAPSAIWINNTKQNSRSDLIGIVNSYVPYRDVAVSQQTQRPRIIFEENSGLAAVIPVDFIEETVDICFRTIFPADPSLFEDEIIEPPDSRDEQEALTDHSGSEALE